MKNARFWTTVHGSYVKVTLSPGDSVDFREGGETEEGFDVRFVSFEYDGSEVRQSSHRTAQDCDGRISQDYETAWDCVTTREPYSTEPDYCPEPGALFPQWEEVDYNQRDYAAERMGY